MASPRVLKLADQIKVIVAEMLERRIKDPRLGFITVTDVSLTGDSRDYVLELRKDAPTRAGRPARSRGRAAAAAVELPAGAQPVFERLRAWRSATAKEQGVPAYVVFHDATLREIASALPTSTAALGTISGIGEGKLAKYGDGILAVLAEQ